MAKFQVMLGLVILMLGFQSCEDILEEEIKENYCNTPENMHEHDSAWVNTHDSAWIDVTETPDNIDTNLI